MRMPGPAKPPSRQNKKQIAAFCDEALVTAVHSYTGKHQMSLQEVIAAAVNFAANEWGRKPILKVGRDRLVKRAKARAKSKTGDATPKCRDGKARIAAWFDNDDVKKLTDFCKEVGIKKEALILLGLPKVIASGAPEKYDPAEEGDRAAA